MWDKALIFTLIYTGLALLVPDNIKAKLLSKKFIVLTFTVVFAVFLLGITILYFTNNKEGFLTGEGCGATGEACSSLCSFTANLSPTGALTNITTTDGCEIIPGMSVTNSANTMIPSAKIASYVAASKTAQLSSGSYIDVSGSDTFTGSVNSYCLINERSLPTSDVDQTVFFNIYGRYVRILASESTGDGWVHVSQVVVNDATGTNIALNRPTTAISTLSGTSASAAVDGTLTLRGGMTLWHVGANNRTDYWQVDLGSVQMVTTIRVIGSKDYGDTVGIDERGEPDRVKGVRVRVLKDLNETPTKLGICIAEPDAIYPIGATTDEQAFLKSIILNGQDGTKALTIFRALKASTLPSNLALYLTDSQAAKVYSQLKGENLLLQKNARTITDIDYYAAINNLKSITTMSQVTFDKTECLRTYMNNNKNTVQRPVLDSNGRPTTDSTGKLNYITEVDNGAKDTVITIMNAISLKGRDSSSAYSLATAPDATAGVAAPPSTTDWSSSFFNTLPIQPASVAPPAEAPIIVGPLTTPEQITAQLSTTPQIFTGSTSTTPEGATVAETTTQTNAGYSSPFASTNIAINQWYAAATNGVGSQAAARAVCQGFRGELATLAQIREAYENGASYQKWGWVADSATSQGFPVRNANLNQFYQSSTVVDTNGMANCYGPKPPPGTANVGPWTDIPKTINSITYKAEEWSRKTLDRDMVDSVVDTPSPLYTTIAAADYADTPGIAFSNNGDAMTVDQAVTRCIANTDCYGFTYNGTNAYFKAYIPANGQVRPNTSAPANTFYKMIPKVVSWSPSTIGGVKIWLDGTDPAGNGVKPANGTTITRWADKSNSGNHATSGVGAPKFNNNRITFDGASYLSLPNGAIPFGDSSYTFFYVATFASGTGYSGVFFGGTQGGQATVLASRQLNNTILTYWNSTSITSTGIFTPNTPVLYSSSYQSRGLRSAFVSGSPNGGSDTPVVRTQTNNNNRIGAARILTESTVPEYLNGSISEFIMFNKSLTDTERETVEGYLAWKWGLQAQLPSTHSFSLKYKVMPTQEVYSVSDYLFTKANAQSMCTALGGDLATSADLVKAQTNKAEWCRTGWLKDTTDPRYPMQVTAPGCGAPGINSYAPPTNLAAANCIGIKPTKNPAGNTTFTDPTTNITGIIKPFNVDTNDASVPEMWSQNSYADLKTCAAGTVLKTCPKSTGGTETKCIETGKDCTSQSACRAGETSRAGICISDSAITANATTEASLNAAGAASSDPSGSPQFDCPCASTDGIVQKTTGGETNQVLTFNTLGRYVRVQGGLGVTLALSQIVVRNTNGTNIALNKPVQATPKSNDRDSYGRGSRDPDVVVDGTLTPRSWPHVWQSLGGKTAMFDFWEVDLGSEQMISTVEYYGKVHAPGEYNLGVRISVLKTRKTQVLQTNSQNQTLTFNQEGRYVRVQGSLHKDAIPNADGYFHLSQVIVKNASGTNISRGKPTFSTFTRHDGGGPELAVDGTERARGWPNIWHSGNGGSSEYWEVDLGSIQMISTVQIYNRDNDWASRNLGMRVTILKTRPWRMRIPAPNNPGYPSTLISFPSGTKGRYVRIESQERQRHFHLSQVAVYNITGTNVALGKAAKATTKLGDSPEASVVVDGTLSWRTWGSRGVWHTGHDCYNMGRKSFWEVDLGSIENLDNMIIYHRSDCCSDRIEGLLVTVRKTQSEDDEIVDMGFPNAASNYVCPAGTEMQFKFDKSNDDVAAITTDCTAKFPSDTAKRTQCISERSKTPCMTMAQYMIGVCEDFGPDYVYSSSGSGGCVKV